MDNKTYADRFWSKVDIKGSDECWEWTAGKTKKGYGEFRADPKSAMKKAHRVAYELANGDIPEGMCVLHTCDNRPCCNPKHLILGTVVDNNADCKGKGRNTFGERNGASKLTTVQVLEIKNHTGVYREVAEKFGVSITTISDIKLGKSWCHV